MMPNDTDLPPNLWTNPYDYYAWTLTISDKYTKGWLLVDSPVPTLILVCLYLLMVWQGPKLMKDRKPFKLNWLLIPYNLAMAALNLFICVELYQSASVANYSYACEPCHESNDPSEMRIRRAIWWYYFSKLLEFTDTFFFIIRKKDKQLSFLHVYHHSTMFSFWWIGIKWVPSGSTFLPAMANSFIHVLMYSYYGLAALGPEIAKYLWWKKYLTIIQLIQFSVALSMGVMNLANGCDFPLWMHYTLVFYMISFILLFGRFYISSYYNDHKKRKAVQKAGKWTSTDTPLVNGYKNIEDFNNNTADKAQKIE